MTVGIDISKDWLDVGRFPEAPGTRFENTAPGHAALIAWLEGTEAQVLLRWAVQKGFAVLPKSLNPERMRQNIDLFGFEIDADDMALIAAMDRGDGVAWATGDPRFMG